MDFDVFAIFGFLLPFVFATFLKKSGAKNFQKEGF